MWFTLIFYQKERCQVFNFLKGAYFIWKRRENSKSKPCHTMMLRCVSETRWLCYHEPWTAIPRKRQLIDECWMLGVMQFRRLLHRMRSAPQPPLGGPTHNLWQIHGSVGTRERFKQLCSARKWRKQTNWKTLKISHYRVAFFPRGDDAHVLMDFRIWQPWIICN